MSTHAATSQIKTLKFKCLRCGHCCTHILIKTEAGLLGLYLEPEETRLFRSRDIVPMYGIGIKGRSRPRPAKIFAYQLALRVCPYYVRETKLCRIYAERPLICKCYPFDPVGASRDCKFIKQNMAEGETFKLDLQTVQVELEANKLGLRKMLDAMGAWRGGKLWVWTLDKRKWSERLPTSPGSFSPLLRWRMEYET